MPLHPGTALAGRYLLTELIGEGGSARVFAAQDELLGREVAIKVLHDELLRLDRERFMREMRVLASLSHPGIIAIHDLGQDLGHDFFTMPLLRGGPLSVLGPLEDTPRSTERFLDAASFIALALHELHLQGLIHRDLTPGNLLLGADGLPRIMDFGLVSMSEHTRHLTRSGITLGTPQYMSPEQARGSGVGPRSDLYALGAVLYRVACGSPPFVGDNDQSVLFQHVYEAPKDPRELNPAISAPIARLLMWLLSKDPSDRPENGQALHAHLQTTRQQCRLLAASQYRGGRTRSGEHPGGPAWPAKLRPHWATQVGGSVTWPYAVVGNNEHLAVGTRSGQLALLSTSGKVLGRLEAQDEVTAPPTLVEGGVLADGVLYGAWDGTLRRVSWEGQVIWTHQTRAELTGTPTLWQELVLTPSRDAHLHANKLSTGELAWAYRASGPIAASALVWAATALIVDENGWLYALDALAGTELWKVQIGVTHATPALVPTGWGQAILIVPTWKGEVHALSLHVRSGRAQLNTAEPDTGADMGGLLWTYDLEDELWAAPAATPQATVLASWSGQVWCLDTGSGDERWHYRTKGRLTASPVISDGVMYLASEAGELRALQLSTGRELWQCQEAQGVQATPLISQGQLIVAFMDGTLRSYQ